VIVCVRLWLIKIVGAMEKRRLNHVKQTDCKDILGFPVTVLDLDACIDQICAWIRAGDKGRYLVCANPHSLEVALNDRIFSDAILNADLVLPDGHGMILASKLLGGRIRERITGSRIFRELSRILDNEGGYRYFFLGSTEENLLLLKNKFQVEFPDIVVSGTYSPPFKTEFSPEETLAMIEAVNQAKPDLLWVGMTAPKQEKWIYQNKDRLNVKFIGAVGAVFDFYIGRVKRSPKWFRDHGLEWLPRLIQEPGRLWDRTIVSAPKFLLRVVRERRWG
jgi:N-acetylglucosaminyldiphosphoundecaprenol N-acetyl-beta-D-mannosaminyltransferase